MNTAKDGSGDTPLDWAIENTPLDLGIQHLKRTETADLLRKHGGKYGPIEGAASGGDIEAVKEFLVAGADVNEIDWRGWTPLHRAAIHGYKEIAELRIAKGADVNAKDSMAEWRKGDAWMDTARLPPISDKASRNRRTPPQTRR